MSDIKCPQCGLWITGSAVHCDCGYNFITGKSEKSFLKPESFWARVPFGIVSITLGLAGLLAAPFLQYLIVGSHLRETALGKISRYLSSDWRFWLLNLVSLVSSLLSLITGIIALAVGKSRKIIALFGILVAVVGLLTYLAMLALITRV